MKEVEENELTKRTQAVIRSNPALDLLFGFASDVHMNSFIEAGFEVIDHNIELFEALNAGIQANSPNKFNTETKEPDRNMLIFKAGTKKRGIRWTTPPWIEKASEPDSGPVSSGLPCDFDTENPDRVRPFAE